MHKYRVYGFTLIELMIVIAITVLLSSFLVLYGSKTNEQITLSVEQAKLGQIILRAKTMALAEVTTSSSLPCGYGIHMDYNNNTYSLFRYIDQSGPKGCSQIKPINPNGQNYEEVFSATLNPGVHFVRGSNPSDLYDLLFVPPVPKTLVWNCPGCGVTSTLGVITFVTRSNSASATVSISDASQVSF